MNKSTKIPYVICNPTNKQQYRRGDLLGKGDFGPCYKLITVATKKKYASKVFEKSKLKSILENRFALHRTLNHRHIVKFHTYFNDKTLSYLVFEYCANGSLAQVYERRKPITEPELRYYIRQIALAGCYLHEKKQIVHRNLTLDTILVNSSMKVKLSGFGFACKLQSPPPSSSSNGGGGGHHQQQRLMTFTGIASEYMAPEILLGNGYGFEVDCWSLGCIAYALLFGRLPFEADDDKQVYHQIKHHQYSMPIDVVDNVQCRQFLSAMLEADLIKRLSMSQILTHSYLCDNYIPSKLSSTTTPTTTSMAVIKNNQNHNRQSNPPPPPPSNPSPPPPPPPHHTSSLSSDMVVDDDDDRSMYDDRFVENSPMPMQDCNNNQNNNQIQNVVENHHGCSTDIASTSVPPPPAAVVVSHVVQPQVVVVAAAGAAVSGPNKRSRIKEDKETQQSKIHHQPKQQPQPPPPPPPPMSIRNSPTSPDGYLFNLRILVQDLLSTRLIGDNSMNTNSIAVHAASKPPYWICDRIKHNKNGLSYLLCDGSVGTQFPDNTTLVLKPNDIDMYYIDAMGNCTYLDYLSPPQVPQKLKGKFQHVTKMQKMLGTNRWIRMCENNKYRSLYEQQCPMNRSPYVIRWLHQTNAEMFQFSNGTVQVIFKDVQLSLILYPQKDSLTYADKHRNFIVYNLSLLQKYGITMFLYLRLEHCARMMAEL